MAMCKKSGLTDAIHDLVVDLSQSNIIGQTRNVKLVLKLARPGPAQNPKLECVSLSWVHKTKTSPIHNQIMKI
ncbi:hypothetical protein Pcinc_026828 [Petrolisthes cinctipes]|uniref:Uncharacterized protein n=1 Tax=Petrolisthes cinctipes TaxID=88211 RepID=A0AAE1F5B0_PETCI|nr:hypothetical protein Pcinc_026828 [Petrolisthes cinctipes]